MSNKRDIKTSKLSIIVPVYNEQECIAEFHKRMLTVLETNGYDYELIFINDGSKDNSALQIADFSLKNPRIKLINLSRNFGHQVAVSAGLDYAKGDAVIIIDADLQDPPETIPGLIAMWEDGYDIVNARRKSRKDSFFKTFSAVLFYKILNLLLANEIPENIGDFRLIDSGPVKVLRQFKEKNRYLRGLTSWLGYKQGFLDYDRDARFAGVTHYPLRKMMQLAFNALFSFSSLPLKIANYVALAFMFIAFCIFLYVMLVVIGGRSVPGWASEVLIITVFSSIQMLVMGIILEYIGRIYSQVLDRPLYIVAETVNVVDSKLVTRKSEDETQNL